MVAEYYFQSEGVHDSLNATHSGGFVGRQRELAELREALADTLAGQGRVALLAGEPGSGKTRLAQELAGQARAQGVLVWWGRCYDGPGAPAYWPWVQALRSHIQKASPEQLRSQMGTGIAHVAELVPDLRSKLPDLEPPPNLEPEQARFLLFDSVTSFLKTVAAAQPLLLVLDDLHGADQPSLLLLQFLAREIAGCRLLALGCYRDVEVSRQHPLAEALAQLDREPVSRRIILRGMDQEDTRLFIEARAGIRPNPGLAETIYGRTQGNPFFMAEVIQWLREQGDMAVTIAEGLPGFRIPQSVREVIGQRLNRLSDRCNQTLTTASVVGREFNFPLLRRLADGDSEEELLSAMDEALAARLIEELPGTAEGYQFSHALIQETLASELSAARRVRLHARIAETLEELYGPEAGSHAVELAGHFFEAEPVLGNDRVARYSRLAGEQALANFDYEEALVYFQRGLAAKGVSPEEQVPVQDEEEAALLFGLVRAQAATRDLFDQADAVIETLARTFDYYEATGDADRAVTVAEYRFTAARGHSRAGSRLIEQALALVPPDSHAAGRLLAQRIRILGVFENDYVAAREAAERALAIARREQDEALELWTLANCASLEQQHARYGEATRWSEQALALAQRLDAPYSELLARHNWHTSRQILGEGPSQAAWQNAAAQLRQAERLHDHHWRSDAQWTSATLAYQEGNWRAARQHHDQSLALHVGDPRGLALRIALEYQSGEFGQGEVYQGRLLELMRRTPGAIVRVMAPLGIAVAAGISGNTSHLAEAEAMAGSVLSTAATPPHYAIPSRTALGLLALQRGDLTQCREHYQALEPHRGITIVGSTLTLTDRVLGLLARALGDLDAAVGHLEAALAYCRRSGHRPELAWSGHDLVETRLQRDVGDDPARVPSLLALLEESLVIATDLGMRPLVGRVLALQQRAHAQPYRPPAYPDGLTRREVEVLRLIAAGLTDREIARELVISVRTAGNHVSSILNKTGAINRTEAAAYATRRGLA